MKSIAEIYEEFVNIHIEDSYKISKKYKELYKELYKEGDTGKIDKIRKEEESEYAREERKTIKRLILAHNFEVMFFKEIVPKVLEIYNQYEGKRIGEKTSDKIRNEVCQMLDTYPFSKCSVSIYEKGISYNLLIGGYQTASFRYDTKSEKFFTLRNEECKLNHLDISMFHIPRKEYVEGIGAFVKEKEAIAKEITDLSQKLRTAINRFNTNLPTGFREAECKIDEYFYFRTK